MVKLLSEDLVIWHFITHIMHVNQSKFYKMRCQVNLDHKSDVVHLNFRKYKKPGG